jgi:hypothetical protein
VGRSTVEFETCQIPISVTITDIPHNGDISTLTDINVVGSLNALAEKIHGSQHPL